MAERTKYINDQIESMGPMLRLITPVLITIVGFSGIKILTNIENNALRIESRLEGHIGKVEKYIDWSSQQIYTSDKRIAVIEAIANDKSKKMSEAEFENRMKLFYESKVSDANGNRTD